MSQRNLALGARRALVARGEGALRWEAVTLPLHPYLAVIVADCPCCRADCSRLLQLDGHDRFGSACRAVRLAATGN